MPNFKSEAEAAGRRVDAYLETAKRLEPEITMIDRDYTLTSIAISLKRIADKLDIITLSPQDLLSFLEERFR
jgi:hypothetical protein